MGGHVGLSANAAVTAVPMETCGCADGCGCEPTETDPWPTPLKRKAADRESENFDDEAAMAILQQMLEKLRPGSAKAWKSNSNWCYTNGVRRSNHIKNIRTMSW